MWSEIFASLSATTLVVLWVGGFVGGIASGAAGFAFGLAASAIWLHAIAPIHVAVLVVGGGLAMQSTTIWTLRHSLDARRLLLSWISREGLPATRLAGRWYADQKDLEQWWASRSGGNARLRASGRD